jgi:hypothetical protein
MDANTLNCYRANYNLEQWESARYHGFPMDAACLAIAELCNEVERLIGANRDFELELEEAKRNLEISGGMAELRRMRIDSLEKQCDDLIIALEKIGFMCASYVDCYQTAQAVLASTKCHGEPEITAKTEVPAIVFFPSEEVLS